MEESKSSKRDSSKNNKKDSDSKSEPDTVHYETMEEAVHAELKIIDERHRLTLEDVRLATENLQKLKESALVLTGAKAILTKLAQGHE